MSDGTRGVAVFTMNVDGVQARKGYFFDHDAIYELGNGITSESPFPVATTVNSCRRNGEIKQGENWVWHDGIGYRGERMKLETGVRKGDWRYLEGGLTEPAPAEADLFTLTVDHGTKPVNDSYVFSIQPGTTPEATAKGPGGKVLAATEKLQAVEFADGAIGAIFYEPGTLGDFSTSAPGVFLITKEHVFAADPTAKLKELTVRRNGVERTLALPGGEEAGSTVAVTF
ncbi:Chondroitinase-AC [bioreactor metagenome]|uniref:Chondroitinase-AC n=1 Tax=bioreactor metagenome TaxID=1076179 RepID=A0A645FDD0_9ZZZZ